MNFLKKMEKNKIKKFYYKYGKNIFRGVLTGIDNLAVFGFNKNAKRAPLFVAWNVTYKCNSRCSYCTAWKLGLDKTKKELNTEEAIKVIRQLGKMKTWVLSFTGGEPLLREDIFVLIKEAKKQGLTTNINTNGFFLEKFAEQIIKSQVDTITVSVESHDAKIHDELRNCKNSFMKLQEGIKKLKELKKKYNSKKPVIMIRANVSKKNYKEPGRYFDFWVDKVDDIMLQPIHEGSAESFLHIQKKGIQFEEKDKKEYKEYMNKLFKKYSGIDSEYYREFYSFFFNTRQMAKKYRCFAAYFMMQIDPYGNVYPCAELHSKLGNLKETPLKNILNNQKIKEFRKLLKNRKNKCFCWYNCTGPINLPLSKLLKWI